MKILDRRFTELTTREFHDIVRLRIDVFVVEQECPYGELDGRDTEDATRHVWIEDDPGVLSYLRVLDDGDARRIGRVCTRMFVETQRQRLSVAIAQFERLHLQSLIQRMTEGCGHGRETAAHLLDRGFEPVGQFDRGCLQKRGKSGIEALFESIRQHGSTVSAGLGRMTRYSSVADGLRKFIYN